MKRQKRFSDGLGLREVKTAGFKQSRRESGVNRRAGLHGKINNTDGETCVKRRKPLSLIHVRRMRKAALALSAVFVAAAAAVGVGFFKKSPVADLPDTEFSTVCFAAPSDGTKPTDHTLVENVGYLNYVLQNQPYWSSEMQSTVNTVLSQRVFTYKQYYDGVLISADIAQGVSSEATQFCIADGVVMWRPSANKNFDGMNTPWSTKDAQGLTIPQFKKKRGFPPSEFSVYVLNEKTIANAPDYSVEENGDGTFTMSLVLNVNTGVDETSADYYYKQQMLVTGGLDEHPVIEQTTVTYVFDGNWRILGFSISDSYSAKMGISVRCTSNTEVTFFYEEEKAKNSFYDDYFKDEYEKLKDTFGTDVGEEEKPPAPNPLNYLAAAFGNVITDGATFKLDLSFDNLDLSGIVHVGLDNGSLKDVRVRLGDIYAYADKNMTLYLTDGNARYKLGLGSLLPSGSSAEGAAGLDVNALIGQLAEGSFTIDGDTALFDTKLSLFGFDISLSFEFDTSDGGIALGYVSAEIPFGGKLIKARLCYGTESDIPAIPADMAQYADILNGGIALGLNVSFDSLTLDGVTKIITDKGEFGGLYATLDDFGVYYDYPADMLYLTDGNVKYKLALSKFKGAFGADAFGLPPEVRKLFGDIADNLSAGDGRISASAALELLGQTVIAALDIKLTGGIEAGAGLDAFGKQVKINVSLLAEEIALPELGGYTDVLDGGITLGAELSLDGLTLTGDVSVCFANGAFTEIRADFGDVKLYYDYAENKLYLGIGGIKAVVALSQAQDGALDISEIFGGNLDEKLAALLGNITAGLKEISVNTKLCISDSVVAANVRLSFDGGLGISADTVLFGINIGVKVGLKEELVPGLSEEDKEGYTDVLKDGWELVGDILGERLSAEISGTLYDYSEEYAEYGYEKYSFEAVLGYDRGSVTDGNAVTDDFSAMYLHFGLGLTARAPADDSLYLDLYLLDANPETDAVTGYTTGNCVTDGKLDVYLSVSKYAENTDGHMPLRVYAPADEILSLVSMVCAAANLDEISFKDGGALNEAVAGISDVINRLLIDKHIGEIKDQFSSLGASLIPQILGNDLNGFLGEIIGRLGSVTEETTERKFSLNDEYIKSISYGNDSLDLVLNSSVIYRAEINEEEFITAELNRFRENGVSYISDIRVNNIFFGENNVNKLDLALALGYGEVRKPADFGGYLDADGLDALIKAFVNSATHETPEGETQYGLNHYYLLKGKITAAIVIDFGFLGKIDKALGIDIKSLAVYIDEATNEVSADAHIYYDGFSELNYTILDGDTDVYLSIRDGSVCIKRIKYNHYVKSGMITSKVWYDTPLEESRLMTLEEFGNDILGNITFILSLGSIITDNIQKSEGGGNGVSFEGYDYGKSLSAVLAYYVSSQTETGASWTFAVNGGLLTDLIGMTMSDIPVTVKAEKNADGTYTVTGLEIPSSPLNLLGSFAKLNVSGGLVYCNPHEELAYDGNGNKYEDTSLNLFALTATVNSRHGLGEGYIQTAEGWQRVYTEKYGTRLCLPLNKRVTENGQLYVLDGYFAVGSGERYAFAEVYTDENGDMFGVTEITDNSLCLAADWKKLYTVTYNYEDGNIETVTYYENETLAASNMPVIPEKYGYEGEWLGAEGTVITENKSFFLKYGAVKYPITLTGERQINETDTEGYYGFENLGNAVSFYADYGTVVSLPAVASDVYKVEGIYDNPAFEGEPLTEITIVGLQTYYIKWIGKTFNVVYESDLACDLSALDTVMSFGGDTDYLSAVASDGNLFLGWFIENGESYKYIADANALKSFLSQSFVEDGCTVTLWAAWQPKLEFSNVTAEREKGKVVFVTVYNWKTEISYSISYADALSERIIENSDVDFEVKYKIGQGTATESKDMWENNYKKLDGNTLAYNKQCSNNYSYLWTYFNLTFNCNGSVIGETAEYISVKECNT